MGYIPRCGPDVPSRRNHRIGDAIAVIVGTWLSLLNHGSAILDGRPPWLKLALNCATPFVVASFGFLAARRGRNIERLGRLLDGER